MQDIDPTILFPFSDNKKNNSSLKGKYKTSWIEGIFFGSDFHLEGVGHNIGNNFTERKYIWFIVTILAIVLVIFGRLLQLQVVNGATYYELAEKNRQRIRPIPSERGLIFDRNGVLLVKNVPNFQLTLVPHDLPHDEAALSAMITQLSELTKQPREDVEKVIHEYKDYQFESVVIKEDLEYETALAIYIDTTALPGVYIQQGSKRLYLHTPPSTTASSDLPDGITDAKTQPEETSAKSLSHVLGYLGKLNTEELDSLYGVGYLPSDTIGKTGIEKQYEQQLRGQYGRQRVEVDVRGTLQKVLAEERAYPGTHLYLTIDANIQRELEAIVQRSLTKKNKSRASAIAMDPRDGSILAMVSLPAYDNNDFSGGIDAKTYNSYITDSDKPLFNRSVAGAYPSGSTIKPLVAAAALQEGIINPATSVLSNGGISVGPWFFPDWQAGGHGTTNVRRSLAWSVNTFYYYIGGGYGDFKGMGVEKMVEYFKKFNLGSRLGIDLPGESAGFVPTREWKNSTLGEPWYIGDTYNISIGQGNLLVTPLQIANITSVVANSGTIYAPRLVEKLVDPQSGEAQQMDTTVINEAIIDAEHLRVVAQGMRDCVEFGSCRYLASLPMEVAGKTGTAQWNQNKDNHAWFTSFAPFQNPEILLTVLVEEGEEGSSTGVPIAYDFYKWWISYKNANSR